MRNFFQQNSDGKYLTKILVKPLAVLFYNLEFRNIANIISISIPEELHYVFFENFSNEMHSFFMTFCETFSSEFQEQQPLMLQIARFLQHTSNEACKLHNYGECSKIRVLQPVAYNKF